MTTRTDFKIIIDLTQIYHDARQLTLVYIDSTKIWHVKQLQEHLIDLFQIPEPFHLLSTGKTYLPPSEDVRILDPNDVVKVVPGTGINDVLCNSKAYVTSNAISDFGSMYVNFTNDHSQISNGEPKKLNQSDKSNHDVTLNNDNPNENHSLKQCIKKENTTNNVTSEPITNQTFYHSIINDSSDVIDLNTSSKLTEIDSTKDSISMEEQNVSSKRRRIRNKQKKFNNSSDQDSSIAKKPRVVSNISVSTAKHIRFDPNIESDGSIADNQEEDKQFDIFKMKKTPMKSLDPLLALRQTSTPLTFSYKKQDKENAENNTENQIFQKDKSKINDFDKNTELVKDATKVKVGDIVDFKILKLGEDFSPTLSSRITAEVVSISPESTNYELKITSGKSEFQEPCGKFYLPDESTVTESESVHYNRKDLLELQIIKSV